MIRSIVFIALFIHTIAYAHPGELDSCKGHSTQEYVEYPNRFDGKPTVPSEAGEYHFHFTIEEMDNEVLPTLSEYRRVHPRRNPLGIDHGSFMVKGKRYEIWEYTRQEEAIIHCTDDEEVLHTGIARIRIEDDWE